MQKEGYETRQTVKAPWPKSANGHGHWIVHSCSMRHLHLALSEDKIPSDGTTDWRPQLIYFLPFPVKQCVRSKHLQTLYSRQYI